MEKMTTVEIGKLLTDRVKDIFGPRLKETKGSGNQKGDLDLQYNIPEGSELIKIWFESKNKTQKVNAIIDRKEFAKAKEQANVYGAYPVYVTSDKDENIFCCMDIADFKTILEVIDAAIGTSR